PMTPLRAAAEGAGALGAALALGAPDPVSRRRRALASEGDGVVPVLRDDRHDRLARHVPAADEDVGVVELGRVQELLPTDFGAVQVGGEKDLGHVCYLSTSTLRISCSNPVTCRRMMSSARSPFPASSACSSSMCSSTASRRRTSRSSTRYHRRRLRLK